MATPLPDPPLFRATNVAPASLAVDDKSGQLGRGVRFVLESVKLVPRLPLLLGPIAAGTVAQAAAWCLLFYVFIKYRVRDNPALEAFLLLLALYVTTSMQGAVRAIVVDMVARYVRGLRPAWEPAAARLRAIVPDLLGVAAIGTAFRFMARSRGSSVMLQAWGVGSFLVVPVLVLEEQSFSDSLTRARTLQSEEVLPVRLGSIGVSTVAAGITALLVGPWMVFFYLAAQRQPDMPINELVSWLVAGGVLWCLSNATTALVEGVYCTCMYLWAREVERDPKAETVRIPDLLVPVLKLKPPPDETP